MSWYYSEVSGNIFEETGLLKWSTDREIDLEKAAIATGAPQVLFGPFATQQEAQTAKQAHRPILPSLNPISDIQGAIVGFSNTLVKLVTRIAEAAVGIVLLAIAANVILKQATGVNVAGKAVRAGKRAASTAAQAAVVA